MKRTVLLVDDEVAILLTLKAVLEISGFDVETAASARDAKLKLRHQAFDMVITDMRMESDVAGAAVIQAAREAEYHPAIALLTAFPIADEDWQELGTDHVEVLMKPMQTRVLLGEIENLLNAHDAKLVAAGVVRSAAKPAKAPVKRVAKKTAKKAPAKKTAKKAAKTAAAPKKKTAVKRSR